MNRTSNITCQVATFSVPLLWRPEVGKWTLQALDDAGRSARVVLTVSAE